MPSRYQTIYDIVDHQTAYNGLGKKYGDKQLHDIPEMDVINRKEFILKQCENKVVLDVGCNSGTLHAEIVKVASSVYGLDKESSSSEVIPMDLDVVDPQKTSLPFPPDLGINLVICGEVLEHLCNPGWLLTRLYTTFPKADVVITVPNAYSKSGQSFNAKGIENVNKDHVSWYSYWTLRGLLKKCKYQLLECHWYNGKPNIAEGLACIARPILSDQTDLGTYEHELSQLRSAEMQVHSGVPNVVPSPIPSLNTVPKS